MTAVGALRPLLVVDTIEIWGAAKVALESIRGLVDAGARVTVANFRYAGRPSRFDDAARALGADVLSLAQRTRADWSCLSRVVAEARARGIDFVETHSFKAHLVGWRASRALGVPWLAYAHGWTTETWRVRAYNVLERRLLVRPDHVFAVARPIEARLRAAGRTGPITVLPNGLDPSPRPIEAAERTAARVALGIPADARVAVAAGRLSPEKGFDVLVAAFARVAADEPRLRLLMAGDGPERGRLEAAVARTGLGGRIRLLGQQPGIRPLLAAADVLVLPSRSEGLPNVVLEGLDAGLPVLATRVGALPELVQDGATGWLVPPGDVAALADGLRRATRTPTLAAMGALGRARILPAFSARGRLERLFGVYGSLATDVGRAPRGAP